MRTDFELWLAISPQILVVDHWEDGAFVFNIKFSHINKFIPYKILNSSIGYINQWKY